MKNKLQNPPDLTFLGKFIFQRLVILVFHFFQKQYAILTKWKKMCYRELDCSGILFEEFTAQSILQLKILKTDLNQSTRLEIIWQVQRLFPKWSLLKLFLPWTLCIANFTARCLCHNYLKIHSEKNITLTCAVNNFLDHGLIYPRLRDCICVTESNVSPE